jgi:paraquat-inducible protein B
MNKANPLAIGGFVLGIVALLVAMSVFFSNTGFGSNTSRWELIYESSVKGLTVGAPVTLRGVKIGEVVAIKTRLYTHRLDYHTAVVVQINRDALERVGDKKDPDALLTELMARGLAAQLKLQSLLTGMLYIDVDFYDTDQPRLASVETEYPQFPTVRTELEIVTEALSDVDIEAMAKQLDSIVTALDKTVNNEAFIRLGPELEKTLQAVQTLADTASTELTALRQDVSPVATEAQQLLADINQQLPAVLQQLETTMAAIDSSAGQLQRSLDNAEYLMSDDSPQLYQIEQAAKELQQAAAAVSQFAETLERQPESLLRGKR